MNTYRKPTMLLAVLLLLALLPAIAPAARAEGSFQAVVSVDSMKVYAQKSPHKYLGTLPRGTEVTVKAYAGPAALISYGGKTGIAQVSDMTAIAASEPTQAVETSLNQAVVATRETRVYKKASTSSSYTTVKAGADMTLLAVNGKCAKVKYNGKVGYALYSHLGEPGSVTDTDSAADATDEAATADVRTGSAPVVTNRSARIYASASLSGDSIAVSKGTKLTLLAIKGDCAMVERSGAIGYTDLSNLESASGSAQTTSGKGNPFSSGSNEYAIYAFLTGEMGYNRAAAMGVMANIKYESGYRPVCNGDGGTSYGICQWHAGRKTNLINYCAENGLDYTELEAQLKFFRYEITTRYASVHSYLKGVENTADGAYDAGYYFCFNYEAPAARTSQSTKRATYARDTLWGM